MNENDKTLNNLFGNAMIVSAELKISLLKTKINLLPIAGPIINEFVFDLYGRIKQDRVNRQVEILSDKFNKIESTIKEIESTKNQDFFDLTQKLFRISANTSSDQKRKYLANIYVSSFISDMESFELKLLFCDFIETMSENHIRILHFIANHQIELNEIGSYSNYYDLYIKSNKDQIDKYLFKYYTTDIEMKSIISTGAGLDNFDDASVTMAYQDHKEASIILTDLGKSFIKYLTE